MCIESFKSARGNKHSCCPAIPKFAGSALIHLYILMIL